MPRTRIRTRSVVIALVGVFLLLPLGYCSGLFVPSLDGRVVTAGNGAPVAEAQVALKWYTFQLNPVDSGYPRLLATYVVFTDAQGRFHSPAGFGSPDISIFPALFRRAEAIVSKENWTTVVNQNVVDGYTAQLSSLAPGGGR